MKIAPAVKRIQLKEVDEDWENLQYWLSRPAQERIAAVTALIQFSLQPGQRMDKTKVIRRKLHDA